MARRHSKEGENRLEQESNRQRTMEGINGALHPASNRQRTMEGINGALHPAVDRQSLGERWKQQTEDNGRHQWSATSCCGWTKPRWKVKATDRGQWKTLMEGYSQGARRTYRAPPRPPPPPSPPQEPSTMFPKCTLECPEHNLACSPDSHWDALEL